MALTFTPIQPTQLDTPQIQLINQQMQYDTGWMHGIVLAVGVIGAGALVRHLIKRRRR